MTTLPDSQRARQPKGSPTGGQYAAMNRAEADLDLQVGTPPGFTQEVWTDDDDPYYQPAHIDPRLEQDRIQRWQQKLEPLLADMNALAHQLEQLENRRTKLTHLIDGAMQRINKVDTLYQGPHHVDDIVRRDGTEYRRLTDSRQPDTPSSFRIQISREMGPAQAQHLAGIATYLYHRTGGEPPYGWTQDAPNSIIVSVDTTKNQAYQRLDRFLGDFTETVQQGTPVRTTNRSGPGTMGTRKYAGMGGLDIHVYADDTFDD